MKKKHIQANIKNRESYLKDSQMYFKNRIQTNNSVNLLGISIYRMKLETNHSSINLRWIYDPEYSDDKHRNKI